MGIERGGRTAGLIVGALLLAGPSMGLRAQTTSAVTGQVTILERHDRTANDLAQTVLWLTGTAVPDGVPSRVDMATEGKQFTPRLTVLAPGSSVTFPNHDPFNHNVFSLSPEGPFDLGLYGRGEAKSVTFVRTGVIRVYCNVHAQMRGLVVVVASGLVTQPAADGSFRFESVPPGDYTLHAWHERGGETSQPLQVTAAAHAPVMITLDARGYRLLAHTRKNGQSYNDRGSRY
jgi:plastocyanin